MKINKIFIDVEAGYVEFETELTNGNVMLKKLNFSIFKSETFRSVDAREIIDLIELRYDVVKVKEKNPNEEDMDKVEDKGSGRQSREKKVYRGNVGGD
jgi:hypothetical protein